MVFLCAVMYSPLRAEPSHRSEMVSQILFGESMVAIDENDTWLKIKTSFDNYEGWVEKRAVKEIKNESEPASKILCNNILLKNKSADENLQLTAGSELSIQNNNEITINKSVFQFSENAVLISNHQWLTNYNSDKILKDAKAFLNTPYLWGGRSQYGIDCSGFTQIVFKINQVKLPRDAYQQAQIGEQISFENIQSGDLAFFQNQSGKITHVGICMPDHQIIHCSIQVKIDELKPEGIWSQALQSFTHQLACIKRI